MSTHLTDEEIRRFADGTLAVDDLLRADGHLAACSECRERAAVLNDAALASAAMRADLSEPSLHLSDQDIHLFVTGQLGDDARGGLMRHVTGCAICSRQIEELQSWSSVPARRPLWALAVAAAVVLAVLIPAMVWQLRTTDRSVASLLPGFGALQPPEQAQVRAAFEAGLPAVPQFIGDIAGVRETLMGPSSTGEAFELTAPVATGTASDRPAFAWRALPGAIDYVVTIFDEQSHEIARSPAVRDRAWTSTDPLPRSRTYVWQVTARRPEGSVTAPRPPAPPARFHVIDARTADTLRRIQREHPDSHALLGILFMSAGLCDEAAAQFEQVRPTDPGFAIAQRSLDRLKRIRG